jgi:hypothetical protein
MRVRAIDGSGSVSVSVLPRAIDRDLSISITLLRYSTIVEYSLLFGWHGLVE